MQDIEEYCKLAESLMARLKELGDSLWHIKIRTRIKRIRKIDSWTKFLGWY